MESRNQKYWVDAAYGAIVADGCFGLAFTVHLLGVPAEGLTVWDFIAAGIIFCVFMSACCIIYEGYWNGVERDRADLIKVLRIKELKQGARLEFDGKSYQVDTIDRRSGEILIQRVGQPGSIVVQIEGQG